MKIILASGSPRRREILEKQGIKFKVIVSEKEEKILYREPGKVVMGLSDMKAEDVYSRVIKNMQGDVLVIGADTVVACDGEIFGKPRSESDAFTMLKKLSGRSHDVFTGVSIKIRENGKETSLNFYEKTEVYVAEITDAEINDYIKTGEPMDKAGAYAIQGLFAPYVTKINGDYLNVIGLPLARIVGELKKYKIKLA